MNSRFRTLAASRSASGTRCLQRWSSDSSSLPLRASLLPSGWPCAAADPDLLSNHNSGLASGKARIDRNLGFQHRPSDKTVPYGLFTNGSDPLSIINVQYGIKKKRGMRQHFEGPMKKGAAGNHRDHKARKDRKARRRLPHKLRLISRRIHSIEGFACSIGVSRVVARYVENRIRRQW